MNFLAASCKWAAGEPGMHDTARVRFWAARTTLGKLDLSRRVIASKPLVPMAVLFKNVRRLNFLGISFSLDNYWVLSKCAQERCLNRLMATHLLLEMCCVFC